MEYFAPSSPTVNLPCRRWMRVRPHRRASRRGFSLVEVVVALGITAFALMTIMSLQVVGLSTLSDANSQMVKTELFNQIGAEIQATPFDELTSYLNSGRFPAFFDERGVEVSEEEKAVYIVRGESVAVDLGGELHRINIQIGFQADPADADIDPRNLKERAFLLAYLGE